MASTITVDKIKGGTSGVALTLPTTDGSAGQLLKTDGSAVLGWATDAGGQTKGADIVSASPLVITTVGDYFDVTGTVSFAAMTVAADRQFTLQFDGILTMTHHATNLDLPGEANITTAVGDVATFQSTGANTVQCINYTKANGESVVAAGGGKLLQLQSTTVSVAVTASSISTFTDVSGMSVNITPSTGSKVLVQVFIGRLDSDNNSMLLRLMRGSTAIGIADADGSRQRATANQANDNINANHTETVAITYLDTAPGGDGSTALTYKLQWWPEGSAIYMNRSSTNANTSNEYNCHGISTITVTEIGA